MVVPQPLHPPAAFSPPSRAGKSSSIPAGASPARVCAGCGRPTRRGGARGAGGHGAGVLPTRHTSRVHRGAGGHHVSPGTAPAPIKDCPPPRVLVAAGASFALGLGAAETPTPPPRRAAPPGHPGQGRAPHHPHPPLPPILLPYELEKCPSWALGTLQPQPPGVWPPPPQIPVALGVC